MAEAGVKQQALTRNSEFVPIARSSFRPSVDACRFNSCPLRFGWTLRFVCHPPAGDARWSGTSANKLRSESSGYRWRAETGTTYPQAMRYSPAGLFLAIGCTQWLLLPESVSQYSAPAWFGYNSRPTRCRTVCAPGWHVKSDPSTTSVSRDCSPDCKGAWPHYRRYRRCRSAQPVRCAGHDRVCCPGRYSLPRRVWLGKTGRRNSRACADYGRRRR